MTKLDDKINDLAKAYAKYPGNPLMAVPYALELTRKRLAKAKKKKVRK